ncbi:MAG: hypothetical protein ABR515_08485 [Nitrososphaeraceae archaeon]
MNTDVSNGNVHCKTNWNLSGYRAEQIVDHFTIQKEIKNKSTGAKQFALKETAY